MKKHFYLLFLVTILCSTVAVMANTITVKGYVKLTNGSASKNTEVNIAVYLNTGTTSCSEQSVVTNNDGFYTKDMTCSGSDIRRIRASAKNCDGQILVVEKDVPTTKIVEANFTLCAVAAPACTAAFTSEPVPVSSTVAAFSVKFNASNSQAGTGDAIVSRIWDFHDGSALLNDRVDPTHTFPHDGSYEVCLTIKISRGCESKVCKQITVQPSAPLICSAKFTFEKLGPKKFRFNSTTSTSPAADNIVERKWDFRDGTTSNDISPAHEFVKPGTYEVCLNIKTAKGCESRLCVSVKAEEGNATNDKMIDLISLYPIPVHEDLKSVIYSKNNNIAATITIVNIDGVIQPIQQTVTLSEGNNPLTINVYKLQPGSYFYKVRTQFGIVSKSFYKL